MGPGAVRARLALLACALLAPAPLLAGCGAAGGGRGDAARLTGLAPREEPVAFDLLLRLPHRGRLQRTLAAIEDPASPRFRRFIGARSFGERFGMGSRRLRALERTLERAGLRIVEASPQRTELRVSASAGAVERLLGVRLGEYRDAAGERWRAPLGRALIPATLASSVSAVAGLDTRPRVRSLDVPAGGLTPPALERAYDVTPLHAAGILGQGETIAVISYSAYNSGDPAAFASHFGLRGPEPRVVKIDGGTTDTIEEGEPDLDIEAIRAIAPEARVLVYELSREVSQAPAIEAIVSEHAASVISDSWGRGCLQDVDPAERKQEEGAISSADAAGISVFVASGDSGAYDCQREDLGDHRLSVEWPGASAGVISVGGTRLYVSPEGGYLKEAAWEGALSSSGGGGGLAAGVARPAWQSAPGAQKALSAGKRGVPDVSADADPGTGWLVYAGEGQGGVGEAGGTSAATPFWAASMLLVEQYAAQQRVGSTGFVDPILYALSSAPQPYPPLHDVTFGGNRYYQAATGWDFATGLGSPDVWNLARDVVAYLKRHPRR